MHPCFSVFAALLASVLMTFTATASSPRPLAATKVSGFKPGAVVYGVVPPLFRGATPFRGVMSRLDDMAALGVDWIWLSPINATDDAGWISYGVTDHYALRADFGPEEDLRALVNRAHALGLKVMMDFVPNHTSDAHPFFVDAQKRGRSSPYYDYFQRDSAGRPQHYFDWVHLPNLNYDHPEVRRHIAGAFRHWVRDFGIDGFRVDAAWGVDRRAPDFWPAFARELRREFPHVVLLAESGARDPRVCRIGFDAAYDWTDELGNPAWAAAFNDLERAGEHLAKSFTHPGCAAKQVARFLNNNDTGERLITRVGLSAYQVAAVLLHTVPGVAMLYAGDEVGAEYEPYDDPPPLSFRDERGIRPLFRRLAELREAEPALRDGSFRELRIAGASSSVFAFERRSGPERIWVLLNFGERPVTLSPRRPRNFRGGFSDLLKARSVKVPRADERLDLRLGARSALVLKEVPDTAPDNTSH